MQKEVRSLIVWHPAVRVVRVLALLKVDDEPLVARLLLIQLECVIERLGADEVREAALCGPVQFFEQQPLNVRRPALVQPEVRRVDVPEEVSRW